MATKKSKKSAPRKAARAKGKMKNGAKLVCGECGLVVTVDETCGCVDYCDVICCGEQMSLK